METIDYPTRKELVAALLAARERGVEVDVVGNGRTLRFPQGIGATPEDEDDTLLGVVGPGDADTVIPEPTEQHIAEEPDLSTFTVEGKCSACGEPAIAEPEGSWVHAGPASHGDAEGEFVPNEPAVEDDEDLIGVVLDPEVVKFVAENGVEAVREAVEAGLFTAEQAVQAEKEGKKRKGILALAEEEK